MIADLARSDLAGDAELLATERRGVCGDVRGTPPAAGDPDSAEHATAKMAAGDVGAGDVAAVIAFLRGRGLVCAVGVTTVLGKCDVRLLVAAAGSPVRVELLGACRAVAAAAGDPVIDGPEQSDVPSAGRACGAAGMAAVRVVGDHRQVWRAPGGMSDAAIAAFLADLCQLDEPALAGRYLKLG